MARNDTAQIEKTNTGANEVAGNKNTSYKAINERLILVLNKRIL
jgi:hypothetical protein